uniref:Secreted protein n=1 Tax=Labrus bergylta TaxID=56723 RepID=A0A3Q3EHJ8_9LABR
MFTTSCYLSCVWVCACWAASCTLCRRCCLSSCCAPTPTSVHGPAPEECCISVNTPAMSSGMLPRDLEDLLKCRHPADSWIPPRLNLLVKSHTASTDSGGRTYLLVFPEDLLQSHIIRSCFGLCCVFHKTWYRDTYI